MSEPIYLTFNFSAEDFRAAMEKRIAEVAFRMLDEHWITRKVEEQVMLQVKDLFDPVVDKVVADCIRSAHEDPDFVRDLARPILAAAIRKSVTKKGIAEEIFKAAVEISKKGLA